MLISQRPIKVYVIVGHTAGWPECLKIWQKWKSITLGDRLETSSHISQQTLRLISTPKAFLCFCFCFCFLKMHKKTSGKTIIFSIIKPMFSLANVYLGLKSLKSTHHQRPMFLLCSEVWTWYTWKCQVHQSQICCCVSSCSMRSKKTKFVGQIIWNVLKVDSFLLGNWY